MRLKPVALALALCATTSLLIPDAQAFRGGGRGFHGGARHGGAHWAGGRHGGAHWAGGGHYHGGYWRGGRWYGGGWGAAAAGAAVGAAAVGAAAVAGGSCPVGYHYYGGYCYPN